MCMFETDKELIKKGYTYRAVININDKSEQNYIVKGSYYKARKAAGRFLSEIMADEFITAKYGTNAVYSYKLKKLK